MGIAGRVVLLLILAGLASAQSDQTPRAPRKDKRGLLQVNRDFYDLAATTGGDAYFWAVGEFAASQLQIPIPYEEVVLSYGSLDTKRVFEIPVESSVRTLTVFASVQRKDLAVLIKPDGLTVEAADVQSYQHMLIATIEAPDAGVWKLELHGQGLFCVSAHVDPGDGPELLGFKECVVSLTGKVADLELELVAKDGSVLARTPLQPAGDGRYSGKCAVPDVPFRAAVRGVDGAGKPFRRVERPLRDPKP